MKYNERFDSRDTYYKKPYGAVKINSPVRFVFFAKDLGFVFGVSLILKKYTGETVNIPLYATGNGLEYSTNVTLAEEGIYFYSFEVYNESGVVPFGRGSGGKARLDSDKEWQLTVYSGDDAPNKAAGGVIYHVFVDRFKKSNDFYCDKAAKYPVMKQWNELPAVVDPDGVFRANDFFGGNLRGITEELDYIESLGVTMIYLSPIFEAASNHRYDTGDYFKIDPLLGDENDLKELIAEAKRRGISVMFDGVFNHTGSDSVYFNKNGHYDSVGAYESRQSSYADWYTFSHFPDKYECWWGITVVPTLNKNNPGVRKLLRDVLKKWIPLGFGGIRLDVADELPKDYIFDINKTVKSLNPDIYLLGEVWEDASTKVSYGTMRPYLLGAQLDSVMNYPFKSGILDYVKYNKKRELIETVNSILENYPRRAVETLMNIIDTHDTVRAVNYFLDGDYGLLNKTAKIKLDIHPHEWDRAYARLKLAALIQFTLPGIPSVYYGDEAGLDGFEDPLNRKTYPWGRERADILSFYRILGKFRREYRAVLGSDIVFYGHESLLIYKIASGSVTVVINNGDATESYIACAACVDYLAGREFAEGSDIALPSGAYLLLCN